MLFFNIFQVYIKKKKSQLWNIFEYPYTITITIIKQI